MANSITTLDTLLNGLDIPGFGGVEKAASVAEPTPQVDGVAKALEDHLNKQANEETPEMSAQKGRNIAAGVLALVKKAMDAEVAAEAGPNNVIAETDAMAASSTAGQQAIPKDGTITQTLQAMLQTGLASGAVGPDQLYLNSIAAGQDEGNSPIGLTSSDGRQINAIPAGGSMSVEVEKTAALVHLVDNGVDFDTAVNLIKQAETQINAEDFEQEKIAAVNGLMSQGYDIETAVALVKQAASVQGAWDATKAGARAVGNFVARGANQVAHPIATGRGAMSQGRNVKALAGLSEEGMSEEAALQAALARMGNKNLSPERAAELGDLAAGRMVADARKSSSVGAGLRHAAPGLVVGGTGLAALGTAGYAASQHNKKASAIEGLVLAGYSVEQALQLLEG